MLQCILKLPRDEEYFATMIFEFNYKRYAYYDYQCIRSVEQVPSFHSSKISFEGHFFNISTSLLFLNEYS